MTTQETAPAAATQAGRSCPLHYRYRPDQLGLDPQRWDDDVLYVVGGLYGNPFALDEIEAMAAAERAAGRSVRLLFNGDFNWFNAAPEVFADINHRVLAHDAMLGNVEYELAHPSEDAGCGCAYPDFVDEGVVSRSNRIMVRLQEQARALPEIRRALTGLSRWRCLIFGGLKVLILHGDPESLAGWGLSRELVGADGGGQVARWFRQTDADVMVCSHTCLPLLWSGEVDGRPRLVVNNGSAGLANLAGNHRGLIARISAMPPLTTDAASLPLGGNRVALLPVDFPLSPWLSMFDALWPEGSDAAISYRQRLLSGTSLASDDIIL